MIDGGEKNGRKETEQGANMQIQYVTSINKV